MLGVPLSAPAGYLPQVGAMIESPAFYPGLSGKRNLAVLAFANATSGPRTPGPATTGFDLALAELGRTGGLSRGFTAAATFIGILVFVLFLTSTTGEYGHGTLRMLLTRQPRQAAAARRQAVGAAGAALGVLLRSTPVALGVGLAWFLPLEHIIANSWIGAGRWFPGLLFEAVARGGTAETSYARALVLALIVAVGGLVVGGVSFGRRDVST